MKFPETHWGSLGDDTHPSDGELEESPQSTFESQWRMLLPRDWRLFHQLLAV
jgi:hypothetical protein